MNTVVKYKYKADSELHIQCINVFGLVTKINVIETVKKIT